jgi:tetratricopeptide (TPR) repeat protein
MHAFGTKDLVGLVGISRSRIRALIRAGHVRPGRGRRGELRFSFQDVIILRTAKALAAASIPVRRINQSLRQLQASLPPEVPLSGLSITSVGDQIAVREGLQQREIESGQYVLALNVVTEGGEVKIIDHSAHGPARGEPSRSESEEHPRSNADDEQLYLAAASVEDEDPPSAIAAYSRCLTLNPNHYEARLNLGRLLHLAGRLKDAERVYREARHYDATLLFNLGVLLEDQNRRAHAISTYREALDLDPTLADAHFNLARLYEREHNKRETLKHLLAYRRLTR